MAGPPDRSGSAGAVTPPRRTRLVLAEVTRDRGDSDRTRTELAEQTRVGEALVRGLVRAQLALALRLSLVVAIGLGGLPLLFAVAPAVGTATLFGINLPWLLLGVAAFPLLVAVGWIFVRLAERNEQDFTALVRRPER
ncbi:hypothetical protein SAMN05444365_101909 [Micromonospora pattaloongensis]|uniref:Uncharacterized protein n=1 Tax=Micromonospora pattaloongensis TaxID=405436 RepID=A0A1H3HPX3_9ACTN|nr:hypothetical protein [Micromonospora pattaloongensis]SDY16834.1 hypothetical protein SAMN05444365_101909 [Micromonospora pattaloongensis]